VPLAMANSVGFDKLGHVESAIPLVVTSGNSAERDLGAAGPLAFAGSMRGLRVFGSSSLNQQVCVKFGLKYLHLLGEKVGKEEAGVE
jgi:hypothetical protein